MTEKLLILLTVLLVGVGAGWMFGSDHEKAKLVRAHEAAQAKLQAALADERESNGKLAAKLDAERQGREADRLTFNRRLNDARKNPGKLVDVECPRVLPGHPGGVSPAADPVPRVRLTGDFVRLWNDGLAGGSTQAERASRPDGEAAGPGLVEPVDVLGNLEQNAARWAECRAQVRGWQSWACEFGFAGGPQCSP